MQELVDILRRHRRDLIDEVTWQMSAIVIPAPECDQAGVRANVERLLDDLIDLVAMGTSSALRARLDEIASRSVLPLAQDPFRASYLIKPALQTVVESEGGDFTPLEPILTRVMIAAGEAYTAACQLRLGALQAEADRLRATSHLVMGVAHELNTPLEIISQAAELVARDGNDDIREAAQLIRSNVTRASNLIRQFRGLSAGETAEAMRAVDVGGAVAEAIVLYRRTSGPDSKLDVNVVDQLIQADGDAAWYGYPLYFTQVLLNLLSNAEHHAYRDAGGPVEIVLERRDDRLHVTVADRGVGIPKSDLDNVLNPFFTTGRGRSRTGLGMAVVHNLVTSGMHGTMHIDSEVGFGTRVYLDLPWRSSG
jgi:signal transduction histidine kinase